MLHEERANKQAGGGPGSDGQPGRSTAPGVTAKGTGRPQEEKSSKIADSKQPQSAIQSQYTITITIHQYIGDSRYASC